MAIGNSSERIKVLRVIGRLNVGGPAIHVVNLTAGMDSDRYRSLLVAGSESQAEGSMLDFALSQGVRPIVIPEIVTAFNLAPRDLTALIKLHALMRRERPHIVHTHTAKAGLLGRLAARLAGVPVVVHTFHGHVLHGYYGPVKSALLRSLEQSLALMTDRLVTVSERVKNELVGYGIAPADKITVVPLGFDLEPFLSVYRGGEKSEELIHHRGTEGTEVRKGFYEAPLPLTESRRLGGEKSESGFTTKDAKYTKEEEMGDTAETQSTRRFGKAFCENPPTLTESQRLRGEISELGFTTKGHEDHEGREDGLHRRDAEYTKTIRISKFEFRNFALRLGGETSDSGFTTNHTPQATRLTSDPTLHPPPSTPHPPLIGIVGRLFPIKNHALFLEAAARVAAHEPAARFVIVGDGILRSSLEIQAKQLGIANRVLFTGWRRDLPRICADLDVLVVSSDNEGTPVSAIEAMAAGCPVVATRVGGLPDLIEDHETGRLVPPRNAEALARAVLDLLENPRTAREMGNRARESVRQRFTVQRLLGDMDRLYRELLEEKAIHCPKEFTTEAQSSQRFGKVLTKNVRL